MSTLALIVLMTVSLASGAAWTIKAASRAVAVVLATAAPMAIAVESPTPTTTYTNAFYHTQFEYPAAYVPARGAISGDRKVDAFVDPSDPETSVSVRRCYPLPDSSSTLTP